MVRNLNAIQITNLVCNSNGGLNYRPEHSTLVTVHKLVQSLFKWFRNSIVQYSDTHFVQRHKGNKTHRDFPYDDSVSNPKHEHYVEGEGVVVQETGLTGLVHHPADTNSRNAPANGRPHSLLPVQRLTLLSQNLKSRKLKLQI